MAKSGASQKQSKPTGSTSTIKNIGPTIASSHYREIFQDHDHYEEAIKLMIHNLPKHPLNGPFDVVCDVINQSTLSSVFS